MKKAVNDTSSFGETLYNKRRFIINANKMTIVEIRSVGRCIGVVAKNQIKIAMMHGNVARDVILPGTHFLRDKADERWLNKWSVCPIKIAAAISGTENAIAAARITDASINSSAIIAAITAVDP